MINVLSKQCLWHSHEDTFENLNVLNNNTFIYRVQRSNHLKKWTVETFSAPLPTLGNRRVHSLCMCPGSFSHIRADTRIWLYPSLPRPSVQKGFSALWCTSPWAVCLPISGHRMSSFFLCFIAAIIPLYGNAIYLTTSLLIDTYIMFIHLL